MSSAVGVRQNASALAMENLIVHIVDDEAALRGAVSRLLRSHGFQTAVYASGHEFLANSRHSECGCILLGFAMPGMSGLEVQESVSTAHRTLPIIFISGQGDVPVSVKAMRAGALNFLTKPFEDEQLVEAVREAVERSVNLAQSANRIDQDWKAFQSLTIREKEVCLLVSEGLLNKQIAGELGPTEKTIKLHRAGVMRKLGVRSVAELVKLIERLRQTGRLDAINGPISDRSIVRSGYVTFE